jgi:hypothetical protein
MDKKDQFCVIYKFSLLFLTIRGKMVKVELFTNDENLPIDNLIGQTEAEFHLC